jgi:6-pyruvoyltetrahydropterin/6-carboxytetrahydropterin synthase
MSRPSITYGQALEIIASYQRTPSSSPIGHNYRLWADVTGAVRRSTSLILPRATLHRALADVAQQFDHQDFTNQVPRGHSPLILLAQAIWNEITARVRPVRLGSLEISDETGQGIRLGTQTDSLLTYTLSGGFSAAHRAHAPRISDAENRALFGTSNNPAGHGHNYWVEIESPSPVSNQPPPWAELDHLNLSHDVPDLQGRNAVTETVAELLARRAPPASRVRVWESAELFAVFDAASGRYQLGRRYRFHTAHTLFDSDLSQAANFRRYGRCALASPHGHAYTAYVIVEDALDDLTDTVYNLGHLDAAAGALLHSFDFANWRQALPELDEAPATAEKVALAVWDRLDGKIGAPLVEFILFETPSQRVQVKRGSDG